MAGGNYDPTTYAWNFATKTWSALAARPFPGNHQGAAVYKNKAYYVGGCINTFDPVTGAKLGTKQIDNVQIYDIMTNSWITGPTMPEGKRFSGTVLHTLYYSHALIYPFYI